jgi:hypothetical protein
MSAPARLAALLLACLLPLGCGGPSYAGGPTDEQPHGVVIPGLDVTIWRVDGRDTDTRTGSLLLEPGRRRLKVRIDFPIDDESPIPFEYRDLDLDVEAGHVYRIDRAEGELPPYELNVSEQSG